MAPRIAVFQDEAIGEPSWAERLGQRLTEGGAEVVPIQILDQATLGVLREADGFMWRFTHGPRSQGPAKPFLSAVETALGLPVWPNAVTRWHYDDKVAQAWTLQMLGAPVPETRVFYVRRDALQWARTARYPWVFKLSGGASSQSVCLVESAEAATRLIERAFARGLSGQHDLAAIGRGVHDPLWRCLADMPWNLAREAAHTLRYGRVHVFEPREEPNWPLQSRSALFQEYVPGNEFDHRITVIGDRAFGYRRFNRPNDFRASGSGRRDVDPEKINAEAIRVALQISRALGFQCMAYDFVLAPDGSCRLLEMSYTFVADYVHQCPGYWDRDLAWHAGPQWPQDLIADDFLSALRAQPRPDRPSLAEPR